MQFSTKKSFQRLQDAELLKLTLHAAKTEKEATLALLDYLVEIDARRLYATVNACSSLFDYLVKELGFSHPAASERVNTIRLIRAVPPVKEHLETGKLTLTSAAQIQRFVNAEQKVDPEGRAVSAEEKGKVVEACLGKSKREVEKTLFELHSEPARILTLEKIRAVTASRTEIKFTVDAATFKKLNQLKDLIGDQSIEKIFDYALDVLLQSEKKKRGVIPKHQAVSLGNVERPKLSGNHAVQGPLADRITAEVIMAKSKDECGEQDRPADLPPAKSYAKPYRTPPTKPTSRPASNSRFIPIDLKRFVFARSKGRCEFLDTRTKARCSSTFRLQIDHRLPLALGGETIALNLRHLCSAHNLRMASQAGLLRPSTITKYSSREQPRA